MNSELKTILITGGAGFIGSNFIIFLLRKYPHYRIVNIDKLTYAADQANLMKVESSPRYIFVEGDITNRGLVEQIFEQYKVEGVIHFAAESHVDNSISDPGKFIKTNINGTFILLDVARHKWMNRPFEYKNEFKNSRFHHISTDEVYGSLGAEGYFTEITPYAPNSPYSASKASSDMIVRSYYHTYGLNVVTTNCSNNYGPRQHEEKLIPKTIKNALSLTPIPIYGDGSNVRDWLYVEDHCSGIDLVYHKGKCGETYNIGGRSERTNNYIVHRICEILDEIASEYKQERIGSYKELITYVEDRPGHDLRYAIDAAKLENELNWKPKENFDSGIEKTVRWFVEKFK